MRGDAEQVDPAAWPPWNTSTGSTTRACRAPATSCQQPSSKRSTTVTSKPQSLRQDPKVFTRTRRGSTWPGCVHAAGRAVVLIFLLGVRDGPLEPVGKGVQTGVGFGRGAAGERGWPQRCFTGGSVERRANRRVMIMTVAQ